MGKPWHSACFFAPTMSLEGAIQPGTVVDDRYRLGEQIGAGAMGRVYRAEHLSLRRPVAVKVLHASACPDREARFRREAFAAARLCHPNCIGVTDSGSLPDGRPYLVMELVRGVSLRDELDRAGPMSVARAFHLLRQVLTGLDHAHAAGLVHRDVKPGNIMLSQDTDGCERVKLLDFGVVKLVGEALERDGRRELTGDGVVVGSPSYMAPEQITSSQIDGRVDLYAATVVLCEMLTDHPPFWSENALAVVRMHMNDAPPRLADLAPGRAFSPELEQLVADGLAKEPRNRMPSAAAFIARLDAIERAATTAPPSARALSPGASDRAGTEPTGGLQLGVNAAGTPPGLGVAPMLPAAALPPPPGPPVPASWQRVYAPHPSRKAIAGVAIAIGVIAVMASFAEPRAASPGADWPFPALADSSEDHEEAAVPLAPALAEDTSAAPALVGLDAIHALIRAGRRDAAIDALVQLRRRHRDEPYLSLLLGTLYLDKLWCRDGFDAYRVAFALAPELRASPTVIRSAIAALASRANHGRAAGFLLSEVGEPAAPYLVQAAAGPDRRVGERAGDVLRQLDARARR